MTIPRIYSPDALENKKTCELGADNLKYLKQVMRLKNGDRINIFDGFGREFEAVIKSYSTKTVLIELGKIITAADKGIRITLAQAIPKARKMDTIVKSAAELGADAIIPFDAERSVGHIVEEKSSSKAARWQKIAAEAARCSHSSHITKVSPVSSFTDMISSASSDALRLIFWEEESQKTIKDILNDEAIAAIKDFFIVVGPEGGFSKEEVMMTKEAGFLSVSLGRQILKVETAAAAIISIIQYEKGIFGQRSQEVKNDHL
ncbi:MAG: RsmE family RNA methyltransferase [Deltaproteobacteria bacterium]|nr:RsmE family RNA methyltransferase [Deltaproteobacteria bacterium]